MNWIQELAWKEAFRVLERAQQTPGQLRKMGFTSINDAVAFEFRRVYGLDKPPKSGALNDRPK